MEKAIKFKSNFTDTQHQNNRQNQGYFKTSAVYCDCHLNASDQQMTDSDLKTGNHDSIKQVEAW